RLPGEHEAADGEEQEHARRRDLEKRFQRRTGERVLVAREEPRRPLQRMAENDEGDGEEAQAVDLRPIDALRDLATKFGWKGRQPRSLGAGLGVTHGTLAKGSPRPS